MGGVDSKCCQQQTNMWKFIKKKIMWLFLGGIAFASTVAVIKPDAQPVINPVSLPKTYFAQVENGVVVDVIVASQEFIDSGVLKGTWIKADKKKTGKGFSYNPQLKVFISPRPAPNATFNTQTLEWEIPIPSVTNFASST